MRTDEPEPGDTPGLARQPPPGRELATPQTPAPPSRAEQLTAHKSSREKVAATERAARASDQASWPQALPGLRAAWNDHKQRYPERPAAVPRTEPDGSWASGEHRRLDPEQNTEAAKACAELTDEAKQRILPALRRIEAADPQRKLAGLEHMVKGEDRLKEKLSDELSGKQKTVGEAIQEIPDAVRFTLSYDSQRYCEGVLADVQRLKVEGFVLIKLKNLWADEQYKGINSQWRIPDTGTRFEMQFHTPESLTAKELTHEAYAKIRSIDATPAERRDARAFQRHVNEFLSTPPGTDRIKDYPEKIDAREDHLLRDHRRLKQPG